MKLVMIGILPTPCGGDHAFLAASRNGDFNALLAVFDPPVILRADVGGRPAG